MKIAIIVLHYGQLETTKHCLKELSKKIDRHQLILVNNTQADLSTLAKIIPGTKLINNSHNLGFAKGVNTGIRLGMKDQSITHFFLMNNDLSLSIGSLNQLVLTFSQRQKVGIVSPILHHPGGYDWGGKYSKWTGMVKHKNWPNKPKTVQTVAHVAGAAALISRELISDIGMLDERFFLYYEDLDFCLRTTQAGYTIHINPDVVAEHAVSASSNVAARTKYQWASHAKFVTKHLFKLAYPTAYLYDLLIYPLWLIRRLPNG